MASSNTGGVSAIPIGGRMVRERERLSGMTAEERAWRAQFLKDQHLSPKEPVHVAAYWKERLNPIRRLYKAPLDGLHKVLTPVLGYNRAFSVRFWTGKVALFVGAVYATAYYFKYNTNDWTRKGGWRVIHSRKAVVPGDEGFPKASDRSAGADYAARGFKTSPI